MPLKKKAILTKCLTNNRMRKAFSLFELVVSFSILGLILILGGKFNSEPPLILAAQSLLNDIALTQNLALRDSRFFANRSSTNLTQSLSPSIDPSKLLNYPSPSMWQIQFHLSGAYTQNSYSIYIDTPRFSPTTHLDGRPMSGDFVAIEPFNNQCLSGYNNTNIADYCKNNTSASVRLKESFGIENIILEGDSFCKERNTARIYFDDFGVPYCGKALRPLSKTFKIILVRKKETFSLCISPMTGYAFFCNEKSLSIPKLSANLASKLNKTR